MAKQRIVNTRFWNDTFISSLDPIEKLLFIYFITNEHTNICGIYELPLKIAAIETGIDESMFKKILPRLKPKLFYIDGWVCAVNFPKHQAKDNPKIKKGIENEMMAIPKDILEKCIGYGYPIYGSSHLNSNLNSNSNINTSTKDDPVIEDKIDPVDIQLSIHLRDLIHENLPTTKEPNLNEWAKHIRLMRERDNRSTEQIRYVIDWSQKDNFWQANILSTKKLREKFDTLVAQIKRNSTKGKINKEDILL